MSTEQMTEQEFSRRFAERHVQQAGGETFVTTGNSVREYAGQAAPLYWNHANLRANGPEECADIDHSRWFGATA